VTLIFLITYAAMASLSRSTSECNSRASSFRFVLPSRN